MFVVEYWNEGVGASVRDALTLFSTTFVVVGIGAISVITENISRIMPQRVTWGAREHAASSLWICTNIQIALHRATRVRALYLWGLWLQNITDWGQEALASSERFAACVPILVIAHPIQARLSTSMIPIGISAWANHCVASAFVPTAFHHVRVCAILIVA